MTGELKLKALDEEDLEVIATHMQDAIVLTGDMQYTPSNQQFVIIANRFNWQAGKNEKPSRRRSAVFFDRVSSVKSQRIRRDTEDAVLSLLTISFKVSQAPAGTVELTFAGGGAIQLEVECIEAQLDDLGPEWETVRVPDHSDAG